MMQQNVAPPTCRECGHVELVTVFARLPRAEHHDRCVHPSGPHPMHAECPWFTAKPRGQNEENPK